MNVNRNSGKEFENAAFSDFKNTKPEAISQLMLKTKSGTKVIIDGASKDKTGVELQEYTGSPTAPLTKNQKIGFPEIAKTGAIVISKNKDIFPAGMIIGPTQVQIIRNNKIK